MDYSGGHGGGFMPSSQANDTSGGKKSYGKDTLRPVTIKQLLDAQHPHPDAEYFLLDGSETTQVTFVAQVRSISAQTTNITYRLDDGTGIIEAKVWIDSDEQNRESDDSSSKPRPTEQQYVRVWGRLKVFNEKRHVGANMVRPIQDFNEIQYHLLEATVVHLHFTRGPLGGVKKEEGAGATATSGSANAANASVPPGLSKPAQRVYLALKEIGHSEAGTHMQEIAQHTRMDVSDVMTGGDELVNKGIIFTTGDDHTWQMLEI